MTEAIYAEIDKKYADIASTLSEKDKMVLGLAYCPLDGELTRDRIRVRKLYRKYNLSAPATMSMDPSDEGDDDSDDIMGVQRRELLAQIFGLDDEQKHRIEIEPPFYLDYGYNVKFEGAFYANSNATILDCAEVTFGHGVLLGPGVHIYAATHSVNAKERDAVLERALPVKIGKNCWIGGNTTIV